MSDPTTLPSAQPGHAAQSARSEAGQHAANDAAPALETHAVTFSGSGKEYFRIWIVNLLLTVLTLGIYSAWAKVRRLQYFDRNTHLAGAVFDFDGKPAAILRGRLLAAALVGAYQYAFGFSQAAGMTVLAFLLLALPFTMRGALRFRLHNTRYRGLRFHFGGSVGGAYATYLPPVLTFLLPGALLASGHEMLGVSAMLLYFCWPLMHGMMKRYQHRHLEFGAQRARYDVSPWRFFPPYLAAFGIALGGIVALGIVAAVGIGIASVGAQGAGGAAEMASFLPMVGALIGAYLAYLVAIPYVLVRIGNLSWSNTALPGVTVISTMAVASFVRLQTVNVLLTILTLGLYRPFAAVRTYQYRLAQIAIQTEGSFEQILAGAGRSGGASSDGVADFLGFDLSW